MDVRPKNIEELVEILSRVDPSAPDARDASGRPVFHVRCRIPVILNVAEGGFRFQKVQETHTPVQLAAGETAPAAEADDREILDRIEGPASSTSVDWYGTRMALPALEDMASQFRSGVDYLPRHHSWMSSVEWYDVMGRTVDARIERAQVAEPAPNDGVGDGWILYCSTDLYADSEYSPKMLSRIRAGHPPGQSIGGWFTQISVTYDDDGCVIYPIEVLGVQLDHLASVRSPANPDSDKVWLAVQRKLGELGQTLRPAPAPGENRSPEPPVAPDPAPQTVPAPETELGTPVVVAVPPGELPVALSTDLLASIDFNEVLRHLVPPSTSSGQGASAPIPEPRSSGRLEISTMTPEQLAELMKRSIGDALSAALAPISERLTALEARGSTAAADPTPAAPSPVAAQPAETSAERVMRERAEAAERRIAALEAEPQRQAARGVPNPAPAQTGGNGPQIPDFARVGRAGDLRTIAPTAARIVARAGDEVGTDEVPHLVWQRDGLGALSEYARACGEAPTVNALIAREKCLTADASRISETGQDFAVFRGGLYPAPDQLRSKSEAELKAILADLVFAASRDRLIA